MYDIICMPLLCHFCFCFSCVAVTVCQVLINLEAVLPPPELSEGFDVTLLGESDRSTRHETRVCMIL